MKYEFERGLSELLETARKMKNECSTYDRERQTRQMQFATPWAPNGANKWKCAEVW